MKKKLLALFLTGLFCVHILYALSPDDKKTASSDMQTFYTLKNLWTDFTAAYYINPDDDTALLALTEYQNQLLACLTDFSQNYSTDSKASEIDNIPYTTLYPFILSEAYFYKYITTTPQKFTIITNSNLDKVVEKILALDNDLNNTNAFLSESSITVNSLFSFFNVVTKKESLFTGAKTDEDFLSAYQKQVLLLHAFSRLEIFMTKNVPSIENIVQLLNDPLSVFILFFNSEYTYLQEKVLATIDTYKNIFGNSVADDINEDTLAIYDCYNLFIKTEVSAQTFGIPIDLIIPPHYVNTYEYFRTSPIMIASFTKNELVGLNNCLSYLSHAGELYVSRINSLLFRPLAVEMDNSNTIEKNEGSTNE